MKHPKLGSALEELSQHLVGQVRPVELSLACLIAKGHFLLEGPPGVGKTKLARLLAQLFSTDFGRIQMTSDVLPSDLVGFIRPNPAKPGEFEFRKGPIFHHFVLVDELNRATPKSQSALLEAMAENQVTVDGQQHPLPQPFFIIATQNPGDSQGVFPLTESQLDRFSLVAEMELPEKEHEVKIYLAHLKEAANYASQLKTALTLEEIVAAHQSLQKVQIEESVFHYFFRLVQTTRQHPEVLTGASVRGSLQFLDTLRALALVRGRDYVIPNDIKDLAVPALAHRLTLIREGALLSEKRLIMNEIINALNSPS